MTTLWSSPAGQAMQAAVRRLLCFMLMRCACLADRPLFSTDNWTCRQLPPSLAFKKPTLILISTICYDSKQAMGNIVHRLQWRWGQEERGSQILPLCRIFNFLLCAKNVLLEIIIWGNLGAKSKCRLSLISFNENLQLSVGILRLRAFLPFVNQ